MKSNHIYFGLLVVIMLVVIGWTAYGTLDIGREEKAYAVSVIVEDSGSDRWIAFKEGLEQGANDYQIQLNIVSTGKFSDIEEEYQMMSRELESGADGVIMELCSSYGDSSIIDGNYEKQKILLVGNDIETEGFYSLVEPDYYEMGKALAENVIADSAETIQGHEIGILSGNQNQLSMQECLRGFEETVTEAGGKISWSLSQTKQEKLESYQKEQPVEILVTLGNEETEAAVDYLASKETIDCLLYGVGCSEKAVYYLDKGVIQNLIVPHEFHMGYQSMEIMAQQLAYGMSSVKKAEVGFLSINQENLYDEDKQKILFPIVQ